MRTHLTSLNLTVMKSPVDQPKNEGHLESVIKGFDTLAVASTFLVAIQAQVMSTTVGAQIEETLALRAINSLYFGGLILDLSSAFLAFLTSRWLQRLAADERVHFENEFGRHSKATHWRGFEDVERDAKEPGPEYETDERYSLLERLICAFSGLSLFIALPLMIIGVICMVGGLLIQAWTQHTTVVAALATTACAATLPFMAGVFWIGRKESRRKAIITRLSRMQGDW